MYVHPAPYFRIDQYPQSYRAVSLFAAPTSLAPSSPSQVQTLNERNTPLVLEIPSNTTIRTLRKRLATVHDVDISRASLFLLRRSMGEMDKMEKYRSLENDDADLDSYNILDGNTLLLHEEEADQSRAAEDMQRITDRIHSLQAELFQRYQENAVLMSDNERIRNDHDGRKRVPQEHSAGARRAAQVTLQAARPSAPSDVKGGMRRFLRASDRSANEAQTKDEMSTNLKIVSVTLRIINGNESWSYRVGPGVPWSKLIHEILVGLGIPDMGNGRAGFSLRSKNGGVWPSSAEVFTSILNVERSGIYTMYLMYQEPTVQVDVEHCTEKYLAEEVLAQHENGGADTSAVRAVEKTEAAKERAQALLRDLPRFLAFFVIMTALTLNRYDITLSFWFSTTIRTAFTESKYQPLHVTPAPAFYNVKELGDIWKYIEGPFADPLFRTHVMNSSATGFIKGESMVVGPVMLRQVRVANATGQKACKLSKSEGIAKFVDGCYGEYEYGLLADTELGPLLSNRGEEPFGTCGNNSAFEFNKPDTVIREDIFGRLFDYDASGYFASIDVSKGKETMLAQITELKKCGWLDRQTRAVFILANIYQPTYKKWMGMMLQFEYSASGLVYPWSRFATVDLDGYASQDGTMYAAFDVILVVLAFTALLAWRDQYRYVYTFGNILVVWV